MSNKAKYYISRNIYLSTVISPILKKTMHKKANYIHIKKLLQIMCLQLTPSPLAEKPRSHLL
ncbi:hypothetical protein ASG81_13500 [Paenibacillus sp. Soil522]|nr:hypothetical protein ASG81_13500 [Paenibacillus sp. Soil522]